MGFFSGHNKNSVHQTYPLAINNYWTGQNMCYKYFQALHDRQLSIHPNFLPGSTSQTSTGKQSSSIMQWSQQVEETQVKVRVLRCLQFTECRKKEAVQRRGAQKSGHRCSLSLWITHCTCARWDLTRPGREPLKAVSWLESLELIQWWETLQSKQVEQRDHTEHPRTQE